jgi:HD superfamily phosphohydrolase
MDSLPFKYKKPDVIWNSIGITDTEDRVIRTESFSRLKQIRQMGVAAITFAGALHTRYEHCIGVMHVADSLLYMVRAYGTGEYLGDILKKEFGPEGRQTFRIAALLHDLGHPPFSHLVEEAFRKYPELLLDNKGKPLNRLGEMIDPATGRYSHEMATICLIKRPDVFDSLTSKLGRETVDQIIEILSGGNSDKTLLMLSRLIDSDLDADKIDYLLRDGFYCGVQLPFKLQDLQDCVWIDEDNGRVIVSGEAIGAINSFLHSRYRLVDEIHHDMQGRIATQILIQDFKKALEQLELSERVDKIEKMHTEFSEYETTRFLHEKGCGENATRIGRGEVGYRESKKCCFSFWDMDPITRGSLYAVLDYPPSLPKLQNQLRVALKQPELLLDVRVVKTTKFSLEVDEAPNPYRPSILGRSETSAGILRDSIRNIHVHFYLPTRIDDRTIKLPLSEFTGYVEQVGSWASEQRLRYKRPVGADLILLTLHGVLLHAENIKLASLQLKFPSIYIKDISPIYWIYSLNHLQHFLGSICEELDVQPPYKMLSSHLADTDLVRDLVLLCAIGLVSLREEAITIPEEITKKQPRHVYRHDYSITKYGREYCNNAIKQDRTGKLWVKIQKSVEKRQDESIDLLREFLATEEALKVYRAQRLAKEIKELERIRKKIRKETKYESCLIVL